MLIGGRYRLERLLGRGGQGSVWRAHHLTLGVPVALKLTSLSSADEQCAERLLREARAAARLSHPAVVRIYDLGCHEECEPFVVMELLEGQSLARRLEREGRLSVAVTLRLLLPIADALRAAHELGFVHRDIKPQNIFLARQEGSSRNHDSSYPKLLDFGVVKLASDPVRRGPITRAGVAVGSPLYLSPEQALCGEVDSRADVWGFCATIYECVTGELPFHGATYVSVVRAILESEPRSLADHGVDDDELWHILKKGFAKSPDERWSSMAELGAALATLLVRRGVREDAAGRSLAATWPVRPSVQTSRRMSKRAAPSAPTRLPPRVESPRVGSPRVESPRIESPRVESPRARSRDESTRVEPQRPPAAFVGAAVAGVVLSATLALLGLLPREIQAEASPKPLPIAQRPDPKTPAPIAEPQTTRAVSPPALSTSLPVATTATTATTPIVEPVSERALGEPGLEPALAEPVLAEPTLPPRELAKPPRHPSERRGRAGTSEPAAAACVKGEPELLEAY